VNRDASLFLAAPGSVVPVRHARAVPGGWPDTVRRPLVGFAAGPAGRNHLSNRSGHDRNSCKSASERGIPRR
jgi:hypothetical protein